jgi:hypothetical protein
MKSAGKPTKKTSPRVTVSSGSVGAFIGRSLERGGQRLPPEITMNFEDPADLRTRRDTPARPESSQAINPGHGRRRIIVKLQEARYRASAQASPSAPAPAPMSFCTFQSARLMAATLWLASQET